MMIKCRHTILVILLLTLAGGIFFGSKAFAANPEMYHYQNITQKFEFDYPYRWVIKTYDVQEGIFSEGFNSNGISKMTVEGSNDLCSVDGCKSIKAPKDAAFAFLTLKVDTATYLWQQVCDSFRLIPSPTPTVTLPTPTSSPTPKPTPKIIPKTKITSTTSPKGNKPKSSTRQNINPPITPTPTSKIRDKNTGSDIVGETNMVKPGITKTQTPNKPRVLSAKSNAKQDDNNRGDFKIFYTITMIFILSASFLTWHPLGRKFSRK